MSINTIKTIFMLFFKKHQSSNVLPLLLGTHSLSKVNEYKHVGLLFTPNLSWTKHIADITPKANRRLGVIKQFNTPYLVKHLKLDI